MNWTAVAATLLALAVMIGAFGAHGLKGRVNQASMDVFQTGVLYHFIHALGLLMVSILAHIGTITESAANRVGWLLLAGIVLFSGSLYGLAVTDYWTLGAVTPIGGLSFIAAWVALAFSVVRKK